jgi:hypothetical protein
VRCLVVLAMLSACGRLAFDDTPADADIDGELPPPVPAGCTGPDEDGDGWPNACDTCLVDPDPFHRDQDGDGVGDVCDPRPTVPGDYAAIADPFEGDIGLYSFNGTATYPASASVLRLGSLTAEGQANFTTPLTVTRLDFVAQVVSPTSLVQWFGVWIVVGGARDKVFTNGYRDPGDAFRSFHLKEQSSSPAIDRFSPYITDPGGFSAGESFRFVTDTELLTGGAWRMIVTDLSSQLERSTDLAITVPQRAGGFLEVNHMVVDMRYMVIYAIH